MRWMKMEQKIVDINIAIKKALQYQIPDMDRCITLAGELQSLAIKPLMLWLLNPQVCYF